MDIEERDNWPYAVACVIFAGALLIGAWMLFVQDQASAQTSHLQSVDSNLLQLIEAQQKEAEIAADIFLGLPKIDPFAEEPKKVVAVCPPVCAPICHPVCRPHCFNRCRTYTRRRCF